MLDFLISGQGEGDRMVREILRPLVQVLVSIVESLDTTTTSFLVR